MPNTPEPVDLGLPEGSPPAAAIPPPGVVAAREDYKKARQVSLGLRMEFEELAREVEPAVDPDEEEPEPDRAASLKLSTLGIKLATQEKKTIQLERKVVVQEQDAGMLQPQAAKKCHQDLNRRYLSAGDDLWKHQKKRMRLDDPGVVRLLDPRGNGLSECLLALYKKSDGQDKRKRRPNNWRAEASTYYDADGNNHGGLKNQYWCHVSGMWQPGTNVICAHIVPFFVDAGSIGEMLFGARAQSIERPGNALFMTNVIKSWFDSYHLVIVPVDTTESPITRWRTDIISNDIRKSAFSVGRGGNELDGKELVFLNGKRPVARFLYFHFIMALVRIKDLQRIGWQDVWARYYTQRPFPTPGNYLRRSMLLALATHFETADMKVVESWITDHGFDSPLKLTDDEATEAARRVLSAVEAVTLRVDDSGEGKCPDDQPEDDSKDDGLEGQ